ncbi:SubName: Full=Uncharacterized protein {ECO:0000313/EMBL:CCA78018.1} [Serendipita indica DSM 11827]|uniref:DUF7918 domain-containing protein n=1 Tax=Serendipita indica (strain DSM 11827) TaxID=1109443 RepID=G4U359_SERID|nr:SubName: Full=Uncharacterized protein {ECO:0000313/EMBL:CCA78018.1} [Serendipita indica DSM 11827]CCA78018.1 hypothetical protein PIIN_08911 [Serendipita indica DSM 11827]
MPTINDISVHIVCGDSRLQEYSVERHDPSSNPIQRFRSCWIASEANKSFRVNCVWKTRTTYAWAIVLRCDGVIVNSVVMKKETTAYTFDGALVADEVRALLFTAITLTDDQEAAQSRLNPHLGTISVDFWRIKSEWTLADKIVKFGSELSNEDVHEGTKTLGGHRTKLGEILREIARDRKAIPDYMDKQPFAQFHFRYRPRDILQATGHIEASPVPSLLGVKSSAPEDISEEEDGGAESDEEEEIAARIAALNQRIETLKQRKRVKMEELPPFV